MEGFYIGIFWFIIMIAVCEGVLRYNDWKLGENEKNEKDKR